MRILVASDSFKGSLTSLEVGRAVADALPQHEVVIVPIADGGEGSLAAVEGRTVCTTVSDPLRRPHSAIYKLLSEAGAEQFGSCSCDATPSGALSIDDMSGAKPLLAQATDAPPARAMIELAQAAGLPLLAENERNPELTTTYGVGEQILDALDRGCRSFYIAIGGSATNDAAMGLLAALGYRFLDDYGVGLPPIGASMAHVAEIDVEGRDARLSACQFTVACDVTNPFHGVMGAAHIFAPQKGADAAMVARLDEGLAHLAAVVRRQYGVDLQRIVGAGAAGGVGGMLAAMLGARLVSGIDFIFAASGIKQRAACVDLIITGEGRMDAQTLMGKAPMGVLNVGRSLSIPVIALAGLVNDRPQLLAAGFDALLQITPPTMSLDEAMRSEVAQANIRRTIHTFLSQR